MPPLETPRLKFDTWSASDWIAFLPIAQDPEVMRYINGGTPWSEEQTRDFVDRQVNMYKQRGFCRWRLLERDRGAFIGFCGVGFWGANFDFEIGWWLARKYWGRGLATEAARAALHDIFTRVGLERVVSVAMTGNLASRGVMEKIGMRLANEFQNDGVNLVRYEIRLAEYTRSGRIDV